MQTLPASDTGYINLKGPRSTAFKLALMKDQSSGGEPITLSRNKRRALKLLTLQKHKCIICGKKVTVEDASVHHFIPTSRGGNKGGIFNQTGAHQSCNSRKSDTAPTRIEWFRYIRSTHRKLTVELGTIDLRAHFPELNGTPQAERTRHKSRRSERGGACPGFRTPNEVRKNPSGALSM